MSCSVVRAEIASINWHVLINNYELEIEQLLALGYILIVSMTDGNSVNDSMS